MADIIGYSPNRNQNVAEREQVNDRVAVAGINLPPDLIYEILCRLPAKSVGRFRCVCKDWQTLLSSLQFIKNQFVLNNHQTKIIIPYDYTNRGSISIDFRDCNIRGHPLAICEVLNIGNNNLRYNIVGSCNGLVLMDEYETFRLSVVNPITHESRLLPAFPENLVHCYHSYGFGYCSNDDDYVVIVFVKPRGSDFNRVYMLKRNLWKRFEDSSLTSYDHGVFFNGSIHWLCYRHLVNFEEMHVIYACDLASEMFQEVELPKGLNKKDDECGIRVKVVSGCLSLLVAHEGYTTDIWVMKEYGLTESWTKYVVYPPNTFGHFYPLFFRNGDESIVGVSDGALVFYCFKQRTWTRVPTIGRPALYCSILGKWTFVESLFSPNSSNTVERLV